MSITWVELFALIMLLVAVFRGGVELGILLSKRQSKD